MKPSPCGYLTKSQQRVGYWERALQLWTDDDYKNHLRMRRETFEVLVKELQGHIEKQINNYKISISAPCRVAITLWRLGSAPSYRILGEHFGLGKSTVFTVTMEVCSTIVEKLFQDHVKFPVNVHLAAQAFCMERGLPNCVDAIDGSHIPIPKPSVNGEDYWNRKQFYSLNMQAVVDHRGRFLDVVIGWPGKAHDARVLCNSPMYRKAQDGSLFPESDLVISGQKMPYYIIADSAYPLEGWLLKPYSQNTTNPSEIFFNKKLSQARMVVERAFGRLKQRWRSLLDCCYACPENAKLLIGACIVLHNLCEAQGDTFEGSLNAESDEADENINPDSTMAGHIIRDTLKRFICGL